MKLYVDLLREYQQGSPQDSGGDQRPVTWSELSELRNHLDELWSKLGVDITFTHHFFDRVNDPRNRKQITIGELSKLFSETYSKHGHNISVKVKPGSDNEFEAVITDLSTKVNLPFVLEWDRQRRELKLVAKTVMRKNDFKTPDQRFVVQQYEPNMSKEQITESGTREPQRNTGIHEKIKEHGFTYKGTKNGFRTYEHPSGHEIRHKFPTLNGNHSIHHNNEAGKTVWKSPSASDTEIHQHLEKHFPKKKVNEEKMKTYRDIVEWVGWDTPEVAPIATPQAVDDVDSAAHSVEKPEMLDKLNAYCHDIANHQYMNPYYPLNTLWKKLMIIGINFDLRKLLMTGEQGRVEVPLSQFGGRFGVLGDPSSYVSSDDGITNRVPGGLNLVVTYQKTGGIYTLDAAIEHGTKAIGFGEETITETECSACDGTGSIRPPEEFSTYHPRKNPRPKEYYDKSNDCPHCKGGKNSSRRREFYDSAVQFRDPTVKEAKDFHSGVTPKKHPFHSIATQHGFEHEVSHEDGHGDNWHTYFHPDGGPALALGTHLGKPAWMHNNKSGTTEHGLRTSLKKKITEVEDNRPSNDHDPSCNSLRNSNSSPIHKLPCNCKKKK